MNMKHLSLSLLTASFLFLVTLPAEALVEIRGGYGILTPEEDGAESLGGLTADVMVSPPAVGLAFGLRYESPSDKTDGVKVTYERVSAQLAYTALDLMLVRLDLVGGIGLSEKIKSGGFEIDDGRTFNVGVLGSVGLGLISLNAELGYHMGKIKGNGLEVETDGVYTKFLLGFGI